jgi:YVTN family beta-propeller protein
MSVVDTATKGVIATTGVGRNVFHLAVDPVSNGIYVANVVGKDGVWVIDGGTNTVTAKVSGNFTPWDVGVDTTLNRIYTTNTPNLPNGAGSISVIDRATNSVLAVVPVDFTPSALAVNSETHRICVTDSTGDEVSVYDGGAMGN